MIEDEPVEDYFEEEAQEQDEEATLPGCLMTEKKKTMIYVQLFCCIILKGEYMFWG